MPSVDLCSTTDSKAFVDGDELKDAIRSYLQDGSNSSSTVALTYGWPIGQWCVAQVRDFSHLMHDTYYSRRYGDPPELFHTFNEPIGDWDVSSATDMSNMFSHAVSFHQDLSRWDTSSVSDMSYMFNGATSFHSDLSKSYRR